MQSENNPAQTQFQQLDGDIQKRDSDDKRKVLDNIHGFIYLPKLIWDFIDTPHFQRLRRIKQLGCLQYVFPGATHSRFEHSIGTAYLARKFIGILIENNPHKYPKKNQKDRQAIQSAIKTITLAGLLHDIGHGPYSHTFDSYIVTKVNKGGVEIDWKHQIASEYIFEDLITNHGLAKHLTPAQITRVKKLISGQPSGEIDRLWEFQIISNKLNGIDVDKFDYFRRDAFYLGAKNIYVDHDLLMNQARIINNQICYPDKYVETVYNIFHCRYKLYKNYYGNIVSRGIELMICDIMQQIKGALNFQLACQQIFEDSSNYIKLTDNVLEKIQDIAEDIRSNPNSRFLTYRNNFETAVEILNRIRKRDIYQFVKEFHYQIREDLNVLVRKQFQDFFEKQKIIKQISSRTELQQDQICISISDIGFGLKEANPLKKVGFFRKQLNKLKKIDSQHLANLSMLYTNAYLERSIKIFIKSNRSSDLIKVYLNFKDICEEFKKKCQERYPINNLIHIIEGSGGKTPSRFAAMNDPQVQFYQFENPMRDISES